MIDFENFNFQLIIQPVVCHIQVVKELVVVICLSRSKIQILLNANNF